MIALYIVLCLLVLLLAVILLRTLAFKPKAEEDMAFEEIDFDAEAAVKALGELVKCRTVSNADKSLEDDREFEKLIALLPELYPNVAKTCPMLRLEDRALLFTWKGKNEGEPAVLMAHYDVVPVGGLFTLGVSRILYKKNLL